MSNATIGVSQTALPVGPQSAPAADTKTADTVSNPDTAVDLLIRLLEDDGARRRLVERLRKEHGAEAGRPPPSSNFGADLFRTLSSRTQRISQQIVVGAEILIQFRTVIDWTVDQFAHPQRRSEWLRFLWKLLLVFALGAIAEWATRRALSGSHRGIESHETKGLGTKLALVFGRIVLEMLPLAAFAASALVTLILIHPGGLLQALALAFVNASIVSRLAKIAARALLTPQAAGLRLLSLGDLGANYLYIWICRFTHIGVYGYFMAEVSLAIGLDRAAYRSIQFVVGLVLAAMAIVFILQNKGNVAEWISGAENTGKSGPGSFLKRRSAEIWHIGAILYVGAVFCVWALRIEGGFAVIVRGTVLSIIIAIAVWAVVRGLGLLNERLLGVSDELSDRFPGLRDRANRYFIIVDYAVRAVLFVVAAFAVLEAWGADAFTWLGSDAGLRVAGSLSIIVLVLAVSIVVWEFVNSVVARYLSPSDDGTEAASARMKTLLPLVRNVTFVALTILCVVVILSELGVNVGPLIAGIGVIGLAVGFGAQTLVKDIITGFFILSENQIAVGDVVRVGANAGLVESLTIRTVRLRDFAGNVHILPFSEVTRVENMTKEFSRYVFDVGIAYREDTDEVVEVLKEIGEEMQLDPHFGELITVPLEIMGLDKFADSAVIVRARITTKPIRQWEVGREFNRRMKKKFDELGIEIPFPHRTVYFGIDKDGSAPPARLDIEDHRRPSEAGSPS